MPNYKAQFMAHLDQKGVKYTDRDKDTVRIVYTGDQMKEIAVNVIFDEDGDNLVAFRSWSLGNVKEDKYARLLLLCNELNCKYRWVKFSIDKDRDICVAIDAVVDIETVGPECLQLVGRIVNISDEAYNSVMGALWGN